MRPWIPAQPLGKEEKGKKGGDATKTRKKMTQKTALTMWRNFIYKSWGQGSSFESTFKSWPLGGKKS